MRPIEAKIEILNTFDKGQNLACRILVDPMIPGLILPMEWKARLGEFATREEVKLLWKNNKIVSGEACGPVGIRIEGFRTIFNEVIFIDMDKSTSGDYQPLLGPIILEQARLDVDMMGGQLVPIGLLEMM